MWVPAEPLNFQNDSGEKYKGSEVKDVCYFAIGFK